MLSSQKFTPSFHEIRESHIDYLIETFQLSKETARFIFMSKWTYQYFIQASTSTDVPQTRDQI